MTKSRNSQGNSSDPEKFILSLENNEKITASEQKRARIMAEGIEEDESLLPSERRILKYRLLRAAQLEEAEECKLTALDWQKTFGVTRRSIYSKLSNKYKSIHGIRDEGIPAKILYEATREFIELPTSDENNILIVDNVEYFSATKLAKILHISLKEMDKLTSFVEGIKGRTRIGRVRVYYSKKQIEEAKELAKKSSEFDEYGLYVKDGERVGTVAAWTRKLNLVYGNVLRALKSVPSTSGKNPSGRVAPVYKESDVIQCFALPVVPDDGFREVEKNKYGTKNAWAKYYGISEDDAEKISLKNNIPHIIGKLASSGAEVYLYLEKDIAFFFEKRTKYPKANSDNVIVTKAGIYKTAYVMSRELSTGEPRIREALQNYSIKGTTQNGHIVNFYPDAMKGLVTNYDFLSQAESEEREFTVLTKLGLEDAIALLQNDPLKLKHYLTFAHPELHEDDIDRLVTRSFRGLYSGPNEPTEERYLSWSNTLEEPSLSDEIPEETEENTITISGEAADCSHIYISGAYCRRIRVETDGSFKVTIPLKIGKVNEIRVLGVRCDTQERSDQGTYSIEQTSEEDDVAALVDLLGTLGTGARKDIQKNPGRYKYLCQCLEQALIKKFGYSFQTGENYINNLLEKTEKPELKRALKNILKKFKDINSSSFEGVVDGSLLFFQKYCTYEIRNRVNQNISGIILANDPGTGKTRIIQASLANRNATIITPNSVVSAWEEEGSKVLTGTHILALRGNHTERKNILRQAKSTREKMRRVLKPSHVVTNREFLQKTNDTERFNLLSDEETVVVHDEGHSRNNETSQQSKGAALLNFATQIIVSATPAKDPETFRRMMAIIKPDDTRFKSPAAFAKAFPKDNPEALRTLSLLKQEITIRFRKEDVMETVDPKQSLSQQRHKLPYKNFIDSNERGSFTMSEDQAQSIYEMFINWNRWCKKNNKYIPKDEIAHKDNLRISNGFAKKHALRQTVNNPDYINSEAEDAKLIEVQNIIDECLKENRKVVIFCAYDAQAQKYSKAFAAYNPSLFTGQTNKKDKNGGIGKFKKAETENSQYDWVLDEKGYPISDPDGELMSALDYERLTFQNSPDRKILIATYGAGAVGTTFTAGKAMIFDDLSADCVEAIQAEDRIHRIDPNRMTHAEVKYYNLQSRYPAHFLEKMKEIWLVKQKGGYKDFSSEENAERYAAKRGLEVLNAYEYLFEQGTYDQTQGKNLTVARTMFRLVNDGIADESITNENQAAFNGLAT